MGNDLCVEISLGYGDDMLEHEGYFYSYDAAISYLLHLAHPELFEDWNTVIITPGEDYPLEPYILI